MDTFLDALAAADGERRLTTPRRRATASCRAGAATWHITTKDEDMIRILDHDPDFAKTVEETRGVVKAAEYEATHAVMERAWALLNEERAN